MHWTHCMSDKTAHIPRHQWCVQFKEHLVLHCKFSSAETLGSTGKAKTFAELLKLPEQPPLPEVDWVSQKPPLIGRNSDKELCEGITLDSGDCPITVDELIQNGRSIQDPCNGSTDAPLCVCPATSVCASSILRSGRIEAQS